MGTAALIRKPSSVVAAVLLEADAVDLAEATEVARRFSAAGVGSVVAERGTIGLDAMRDLAVVQFGPNVPLLIAADLAVRSLKATERDGAFAGSVLMPAALTMTRALGARAGGAAASPTMFLIDGSVAGLSLWTRLAGRVSGGRIATLADLDTKSVRHWLEGAPKGMSMTRKASIAAAAAAAVSMPVGMVSVAGATPTSVSQGGDTADTPQTWAEVKAAAKKARISGDSKAAARKARTPEERAAAKAKHQAKRAAARAAAQPAKAAEKLGRSSSLIDSSRALTPSAVAGDGQQAVGAAGFGSWTLAGPGMSWFANTNITNSTAFSASGAIQEASMVTTTVITTTSSSFSTSTTLTDAFDGYGSLYVRNVTSGAAADVYNQTGQAPTESCGGQQLEYPTITMEGLEVSRSLYASPDYPFARWLDSVTNPTGAPVTIRFGRGEAATFATNELGSDADTTIETTSSGDNVASTADAYVVTSDNGVGPDPVIGHVIWGGTGDAVAPDEVNIVDGDDQPSWFWEVTIDPGETVSIAQYAALGGFPALSELVSVLLADQIPDPDSDDWSPGLLCMTEDQISGLINFDKPEVTVDDITVDEDAGTAPLTFTRSYTGGPATMQVNLVNGTAGSGDYVNASPFIIHFEPGQDTYTIDVPITDDTDVEALETVSVEVVALSGYAKVASTLMATISIVDNDAAATTTTTTTTTSPSTTAQPTTAPSTTAQGSTTAPATTVPSSSGTTTTTTTEPTAGTTTTQPTTTGTTTTTDTTTTAPAATTSSTTTPSTTTPSTTTPAQVLGAQQNAQPVARTGTDGGRIAGLAGALVALGGGLVSFGRRRRRED